MFFKTLPFYPCGKTAVVSFIILYNISQFHLIFSCVMTTSLFVFKLYNEEFFSFLFFFQYRDMSLNLFRKHIMSNPTVQSRTVDGLLQLIENER